MDLLNRPLNSWMGYKCVFFVHVPFKPNKFEFPVGPLEFPAKIPLPHTALLYTYGLSLLLT